MKSETSEPLLTNSLKELSRRRSKTATVMISVRFSGEWADLWSKLMEATKAESPTELVRQSLQVRALLEARDDQGERVKVMLYTKGPDGQEIAQDVREFLQLENSEGADIGTKPASDRSTVN